MCAAVLSLEAVVVALTAPVAIAISDVEPGVAIAVGLGLAVVCVLAAGMLRTPRGYQLGWVAQVAAIALGFLVTSMFFLGAMFALLWGTADYLGRKIERERAEAYARFDAGDGSSPA
jgi:hypothetical protein